VFTNWLPLKRRIEQLGLIDRNRIVLDLSRTKMVDHSVMERLHELEMDFEQAGLQLDVLGLESHQQFSAHPHAARRRRFVRIKRVTIVAESELEAQLTSRVVELGASGYTAIPCRGAGRRTLVRGATACNDSIRIEIVAPAQVAEQILEYIHREISLDHAVTACVETVEVLKRDQF
jgi:MFS superfamily sulfate permease-like transporter